MERGREPRALFVGVAEAERYVSALRTTTGVVAAPEDGDAPDDVDVLVVGGDDATHDDALDRLRERYPDAPAVAVGDPDDSRFAASVRASSTTAVADPVERLAARSYYDAAVDRFFKHAAAHAEDAPIDWDDEELSAARREADEALETVECVGWEALATVEPPAAGDPGIEE